MAALGGVLVFVSLFLAWFGDLTGWESFEALDLVIAVAALAAVAMAVNSLLGRTHGAPPRLLPVVGVVLVAVVAVQLIEPPPVIAVAERVSDVEREIGGWLALTGSLLILLGGALRLASISVTVSLGDRDMRRRVPAVDRRPAASGASASPTRRPDGPVATRPEGSEAGAASAAEEAAARRHPEAPADDDQRTQQFSALDER